ncbi:hypothetical protein TTHERM_00530690 (macronuclear) [Tetrahymena thermophila SB210]|uniref:Uncharacterized protein n=1 Tax=Tetrahymena thermophila (strain SB210) TaxID=312017 RepID=I7M6F5_TETTS|nr:hypothetical protein TTHERM_00530690 [Tetrahymena thermophila SB210]EAR85111.2 hypothetical protein TTHERM_00530690 [Tetrahymena thermophila SB210]|eukprot:XP_001032774.2 hypothetical protein TTHERM_00530690 [Tetrahymena thermophila SB210]
MHQNQQKIMQQGGLHIPQNSSIPQGHQINHPPLPLGIPPHPHHLHHPPPPGIMPMQMPPPPHQGMIQGHPHMPPPPHHLQHMQFMGQNGQFQQQQQQLNVQGKQMLPSLPNMQMMPPLQNQNQQPGPQIIQQQQQQQPPMFNPQYMNQFQPLNNQQGQNMHQIGPNIPPQMQNNMNQMNQQYNIRQPSPNNQNQIPVFPNQIQPQIHGQQYQDFSQQQQILQNPQQLNNAYTNNLVFNPSQQQLQQQHEMHIQKLQKEEPTKKRSRWGDQVQMINNLTPQQLNQQHFIMPGTTQSGGNLNQRRVVLNSKNPELLSGSIMVELVKQNNRKITEESGRFKKYQPIDPSSLPDYIYVENKDQSSLKSKLNQLLDYADDIRDQEIKNMEKKKKERERELELKKMEEQGLDTSHLRNPEKKASNKRNIDKEVEELYCVQKGDMMSEMGIRSDGRVAGPQVQGLGLGGPQSLDNVIKKFKNVFYYLLFKIGIQCFQNFKKQELPCNCRRKITIQGQRIRFMLQMQSSWSYCKGMQIWNELMLLIELAHRFNKQINKFKKNKNKFSINQLL